MNRSNRSIRLIARTVTATALVAGTFLGGAAANATPKARPGGTSHHTAGEIMVACAQAGGTYFGNGTDYGCIMPGGKVIYCWESDNQCIVFFKPAGGLAAAAPGAARQTMAVAG